MYIFFALKCYIIVYDTALMLWGVIPTQQQIVFQYFPCFTSVLVDTTFLF